MLRMHLSLLAAVCAAAPLQADACVLIPPPMQELVSDIAVEGVLISGTVVQAFDAARRLPEIIRADEIFVGDGEPRDFVIYYTEEQFEGELRRAPDSCQDGLRNHPPLGRKYDRLVLEPARRDGAATGGWRFSIFGSSAASGKGLELLVPEAIRTGRFKSRPPLRRQWGDPHDE